MARLGKYTLVIIGGEQVAAQMDSSLSFEQSLIEITGTGSLNRFKNFDFDERTVSGSFSVQQSDAIEDMFWNYFYQAQRIIIYYGGIENGDKYYQFNAIITKIDRSDPVSGISNLSISFTVDGEPKRLTVSESSVFWNLTLNVYGDGSASANPDYLEYADGSEVGVSASANAGSEFAFFMPDDATAIGDLEYDNPLTVLMDADKTKTAYFALDELDYVFDASSGADWVLGSFWNNPDGYPLKYECDFQADGVLITVTNVSESNQIAYILDFDLRRNIVASYLGVYFDIVTTGHFGVGLGITNFDNGYNLLRKETEILYSTDEPSKLIAITPQTLVNRIFLYSYSMVISPSASVKFKISRIRLSKTAFTL